MKQTLYRFVPCKLLFPKLLVLLVSWSTCHLSLMPRRSLYAAASQSLVAYSPRAAYIAAWEEWLPRFNIESAVPLFTLDDVIALGDMYYLPFEVRRYKLKLIKHSESV